MFKWEMKRLIITKTSSKKFSTDSFSFYDYCGTIFLLLFWPSVYEFGAWQFSCLLFWFWLKTWNSSALHELFYSNTTDSKMFDFTSLGHSQCCWWRCVWWHKMNTWLTFTKLQTLRMKWKPSFIFLRFSWLKKTS